MKQKKYNVKVVDRKTGDPFIFDYYGYDTYAYAEKIALKLTNEKYLATVVKKKL